MFKGVRFILIGLCALFSLNTFALQEYTGQGLYEAGRRTGTSPNFTYNCHALISAISSFNIGTMSNNWPSTCRGKPMHVISGEYYFYGQPVGANCLPNSTNQGGTTTCIANDGYNVVSDGNGNFQIKPQGQECTSPQVYNSQTGTCGAPPDTSCGDVNNPSSDPSCTCSDELVKHFIPSQNKYRCMAPNNLEEVATGVIIAGGGLSIAVASGLFAGLAACLASLVCAAGLGLFGLGVILAGAGGILGLVGDNQDDSTPSPSPLTVKIAPPNDKTSKPPQPDVIRVGGGGDIKPPSNATVNPNNPNQSTWNNPSGNGTATIDNDNNTVTVNNNSNGVSNTTVIQPKPNGQVDIRNVKITPYGTSSSGAGVSSIETSIATASYANLNPNTTTQTQYSWGGNLSTSPPTMIICTAPNCTLGGGGDQNDENNGGDCAEYGCAKEVTQLQVLAGITQSPPNQVIQEANTQAESLFQGLVDAELELTANMQDAINNFLENSGLDDVFEGWGAFNPFANVDNQTCSITSEWFGNRVLSYCDEQPVIHILMQFMFSVFFSLRIFSLVTNENGYDKSMF